ncbi:MAG: PKD domain-containing protein [Bacteroidota bacterium]
MKKLLSLIVLCFGLVSCLFSQVNDTVTVSGTVTLGAVGLPIPGFDIDYLVTGASYFYAGQVQTDPNGHYTLDVVYPVTMPPDITLTYADCFMNPLPTQVVISQLTTDTIQDIALCQNYNCSADFTYFSDPANPLTVDFSASFQGLLSYSWDFGDGTTGSGSSVQHTYSVGDTFQVCLIVDDGNGCVDTSCLFVAVGALPPGGCDASFSLLPNAGPLNCFMPASLGMNPDLVYFWDFGDGTTSLDPVACHGYLTPDTFTVCLVVLDTVQGCTDTSCVDFINGGWGGFCYAGFSYQTGPNDTVAFTNASYGSGGLTYQWDFGDGNTSTLPDPVHVFGGDSAYYVCLTITDSTGCTNTFCDLVIFGCEATFLCDPDPINPLTVNFLATTPAIASYTWDFGDGNVATGPAVTHTYAVADTYIVCLMVDDGMGCTDTTCMTAVVGGNTPFPCDASFQIYPSPGGICFGPVQPFLASSFMWDFGDGTSSTDPYPCHSYSNLMPGDSVVVCLTMTDPTGCVDTSCQTVIVPGTGCSAAFTATPDTSGLIWTLMAVDTTVATYTWDFAGATVLSNANPWEAVIQFSTQGVMQVCLQVSDATGCQDYFCEPLIVGWSGFPCDANFSYSPTGNNTVVFSAGLSFPGALFVWDFGDGVIDSTHNLTTTHTYSTAGTYQACLTVINANGCIDMACQPISTFPNNPPNTLSILGQVLTGTVLADDYTAYLIEYDSVAGTLTAIDTFVSSFAAGNTGFFYFNVQAGSYLVKVALNTGSQVYANYMPTYFGDELFWNNASYIDPGTIPFIAIDMIAGTNPGGPGFVGGLVSQGANKQGDPMEGMHVLITHMDDSPLAYTLTHEDGTFSYDNLPYGTYKVWVEMWGRDLNYHVVTISPDQPSVTDLDFEISDTDVVAGGISGVDEYLLGENSWKVFPNPATNLATVVLRMEQMTGLTLSMSNVLGQEVYRQSHQAFVGENTFELPVQQIESGIYMIQVEIQGTIVPLSKLIVKR